MEKVRDLTKCIIPEGMLMAEVIKPKRYIVAPDGTKDEDSYGKVIMVHESVKDIKPGDYIIRYSGKMDGFTVNRGKDNERLLTMMHRGCVIVAVTPENFIDPDILTASVNI
jgi:hypothetical protein